MAMQAKVFLGPFNFSMQRVLISIKWILLGRPHCMFVLKRILLDQCECLWMLEQMSTSNIKKLD
jgi:hypothetical protein